MENKSPKNETCFKNYPKIKENIGGRKCTELWKFIDYLGNWYKKSAQAKYNGGTR